jgi:2-methylcitrate dehydratase PrpD
MKLHRRKFLTTSALTGTAALAAPQSAPQAPPPVRPAPEATKILARFIVNGKLADIPAPVRKEGARTLLNWVGCTIGGSRDEAMTNGLAALAPFFGPAQASLLGRKERPDIFHAALFNGIASHVLDFDDTHLRTIIHPAGPVCSALLALSEYKPISGAEFLTAMVYGIETECRIGNSVYPAHYDTGWHITGTAGVFGAAAAAGRVLGLNEQQMRWALGLAAVQPVGLREMFGSMTKSFHPGRAAQNGLTAALMAKNNFTSSEQGLEAKSGWANVLSTQRNYSELTDKLSQTWELSINTYKPFACGIVIHPTIDACIQLRNQNNLKAADIEKVELRVHPLVLELTGKKTPQAGLESKFSVYHAAAAAIVEGACGVQQFSDRAAKDPVIMALRDRVSTTIDPAIKEDQVRVAITLKDGRKLEKYIEQAVGSVNNPMSDKDLEAKFSGLADGILPRDQVRKIMDNCWGIEALPSAATVATSARA